MSLVEDVEFNDQAFLWDFIKKFNNKVYKPPLHDPLPVEYKNFLQIVDDDPMVTMNRLYGDGIDSLNDLTTAQLGFLVPSIEIFKIIEDENAVKKSIKFPFNEFTTIDSITKSHLNRGTDAGLKGVSWEDTGVNPAAVGVSFKGVMNLYFQSFEGIFLERVIDGHKISFSDLMDQQGATGKPTSENEADEKSANPGINAPLIKLKVGWSVPKKTDLFSEHLIEQIRSISRSYIIRPWQQEITIGEAADVNLKIDFWANIEGYGLTSDADLLYINKNSEDGQKIKALKTSLKKLKEEYKNKDNYKMSPEDIKKNGGKPRVAFYIPKAIKDGRKIAKMKREGRAQEIRTKERIKEEYNSLKSETRSLSYRRLLSVIKNSFIENSKNGRLFYIDLDKDIFESYEELLTDALQSIEDLKEARKEKGASESKTIEQKFKDKRRTTVEGIVKQLRDINISSGAGGADLKALDKANTQKNEADIKQAAQSIQTNDPSRELGSGGYRLHYFYLGDLIDAIMKVVYERPETTGDGGNRQKLTNSTKRKKMEEHIKLICGSFTYIDTITNKKKVIDLADVPVSLNMFNAWFIDNVISKNLNHYPLRAFLRDLCSKLLNNVISPSRMGAIPTGKDLRVNVQTICFKEDDALDKAWKNRSEKSRIQASEISFSKGKSQKPPKEYMFLYVIGSESDSLNGDMDQDKSRNIPHFFVGADRGILKQVQFSKTKIKYLLEASLGRNAKAKSNLLYADRYDAQVVLLGNPGFKPGSLLYIDPRAYGLGLTKGLGDPQWRADLGIGGYYRVVQVSNEINEDKFETSLKTINEYSTRQMNKKFKNN